MTLGLLYAALSVLVWGVTFVNTRALLHDFTALEIQILRFAVAYAALWAIHPRRHAVARGDERHFALLGLTGVTLYQLLENCAIHYTNASNVAILVSVSPVATAVFARLFFRGRPLQPLFFLGFAVAIAGVALVSLEGVRAFRFSPAGDLMALAAMLSWSVYSNLLGRLRGKDYPQEFVIRRAFFWMLVFTAPLAVFGATPAARAVAEGALAVDFGAAANRARFCSWPNLVNLAFLGVFASAACFVLWNKACLALGVVRCTVGIYLIPAVTVVVARVFLGETLNAASAAGALLILAGVAISGRCRDLDARPA